MTSDEITVRARNLDFSYGDGSSLNNSVLSNIDLDVSGGEVVLITGPSGSGKTTLLTLIGALRRVQSGSLRVLGRELAGASPTQLVEVRRQIGYVFQSHNLLGFLTALQNVQMSAQICEVRPEIARQRSREMLTEVDLGEYSNAYPHDLSGGQRQRVAIARALVNRPRLVLADEPTASLDGKSGREIVDLMYKLALEQHCSVLIVTHDHRISNIANRVLHIEDGRLS
jgi:putative ABC transport system ATP-binding protein